MKTISFLGTGVGMGHNSNTVSMLLEDETTNILLDTSGGHQIIGALHKMKRDPLQIQNIFITHHDSDHILGLIPLIRAIRDDTDRTRRRIYCSKEVNQAVESLFAFTARRHFTIAREFTDIVIVEDGDIYNIGDWRVTFFDINSSKTPQMGCKVVNKSNKSLVFTGDEPISEAGRRHALGCNTLIHEAFCTYGQAERFKPHEKYHSTARDAGKAAHEVGAERLITVHMEDDTLETRKALYARDIRDSGYEGKVFIPHDFDILDL